MAFPPQSLSPLSEMPIPYWKNFIKHYGGNPNESTLFRLLKKAAPLQFLIVLITIIYKPPTLDIQLHAAAMMEELATTTEVLCQEMNTEMEAEWFERIKEAALEMMAVTEEEEEGMRRCGVKITAILVSDSLLTGTKPCPEFAILFEAGFADQRMTDPLGSLIEAGLPIDYFCQDFIFPYIQRYPRHFVKTVIYHARRSAKMWPFVLIARVWRYWSDSTWRILAGAAIMAPFFERDHCSAARSCVGETIIMCVELMIHSNLYFTEPMIRSLTEITLSLFEGYLDEQVCAIRLAKAIISISPELIRPTSPPPLQLQDVNV